MYILGLCRSNYEWPDKVWSTMWDMARRDYFPSTIEKVMGFSYSAYGYAKEIMLSTGLAYDQLTRHDCRGVLVAPQRADACDLADPVSAALNGRSPRHHRGSG